MSLIYYDDVGAWFCREFEGHDYGEIPLNNYLENKISEINELMEESICNRAIILADADQIVKPELAEKEECFLLYRKERVGVLKVFCKAEM